ncbi:MAG: hypothetical protein MPN21_15380 [Thermoanaerobaculia bacterium]|nr:hypothetical protein [Thermoanaerobaculia bacterium]
MIRSSRLFRRPLVCSDPESRPRRAATILEVLVAMAVLGLCLLFMTQILVQDSFLEQRNRSRVASLRLLEAHSEIVRAGLPLPEDAGSYEMELLVEPARGSGVERPALRMVLEALEPAGLWRVDLVLTYQSRGRPLEQSMEMRLWRP